MKPPKIIAFYGVNDSALAISVRNGGHGTLVCFVDEAINGHEPPYKKSVFLEHLNAVRGTGRDTWATVTVNC